MNIVDFSSHSKPRQLRHRGLAESSRRRNRRSGATALWAGALALAFALTTPGQAEVYGAGVHLETSTAIAAIVDDPDAFAGERVRVEGPVTDVCPRKGCWMSLRSGDAAVRIKVDDGVIVFPSGAKDHQAAAEGRVEVLDLDRDSYTSWMAHLADEKGETFDPESVGDGPYRLVQIRGEGAEIDLSD